MRGHSHFAMPPHCPLGRQDRARWPGHGGRSPRHRAQGERGGRIRLERIENVRKDTIQDFVERTVSPEAEAIYTDELRSYIGVETDARRPETIRHIADE